MDLEETQVNNNGLSLTNSYLLIFPITSYTKIYMYIILFEYIEISSARKNRGSCANGHVTRAAGGNLSSRCQPARRQIPDGWISIGKTTRPQTSECLLLLLRLHMLSTTTAVWCLIWGDGCEMKNTRKQSKVYKDAQMNYRFIRLWQKNTKQITFYFPW